MGNEVDENFTRLDRKVRFLTEQKIKKRAERNTRPALKLLFIVST